MRLTSLVRFETGRRLRPARLVLPWGLFLSIHWIGTANGLDSDGMFGYAFLAALGIGLQPHLRDDADRGFSRLCAVSLFSARTLATARLASWLAWLVLLGFWSFACTAALPGGLGPAGAERALVFTLLGVVLLPAAAAVDRWAGLRLPLMTVYLSAMAAALLVSSLGGEASWIPIGLGLDPAHDGSGAPAGLMARMPVSILLSWAVFTERGAGARRSSPGIGPLRLAMDGRSAMVDSDLHPIRHGPRIRIPLTTPGRRTGDRPGPAAHVPRVDAPPSAPGDGSPPR